ncbi:hypothetical protein [uncultured Draconibacterium sp.]|uniref:hypothetical protein n=1 Tax=uncultured Draconibacterium sp. TaxID=1573823 RepID=UPI0029C6BAFE|nr:hypothetical protein [uncultured Draconibacterium sp.]
MKNTYYNGWILFLVLCFVNALLAFSFNYLFVSDILYYQTYGEQLALSRIDKMLEFSKKWEWLGYISMPIILFIRVAFVSLCLYIGIFFVEIDLKLSKLFKIALLSEFVYFLSGFAKLIVFIFFKEISTLNDLQFTPFSLLNIFDKDVIDPLFVPPLGMLNIFTVAYFLVLAWLLKDLINEEKEDPSQKYGGALKLVVTSYGSGLLLWVVLGMFLTLNLN